MIACPYCFKQLNISEAMEQLIGRIELVIQCSSCSQRVVYKKVASSDKVRHGSKGGDK